MRILWVFAVAALNVEGQVSTASGPAPFTAADRLNHYLYRTYSWQRMSFLAADTALEHLTDSSRAWDRTTEGYAYRLASGFGGRVVRNTIELGAGIAFGEDYRFHPSQEQSFWKRFRFAVSGAVMGYDSRGTRRFSYSRLAAQAGGSLASSTWRPSARNPGRFVEDLSFGFLGQAQNNLLTEFSPDLMRFGKNVKTRLAPVLRLSRKPLKGR